MFDSDSRPLHTTTFGEPLGVLVIKPIQILNEPGGMKATKSFCGLVNQGSQVRFPASPKNHSR